ncbi:MAG: hypothetical protein WCD37_16750 [Chloroflexia bacterium]
MMQNIRALAVGFSLVALVWLWSAARSTQAATPVFGAAMDFGTGCLLGGAQDKKFVPHVEAAARIRGGETYKIYSLKGKLGTATGGKPAPIGMPCVQTTAITTQPSYTDKEVIALGGNWPGMPRVPAAINVNNATYKASVRDLLRARGLSNPKISIDQIYRIDLEGDRVAEVLISASYFSDATEPQAADGPGPDAAAGDYSILFMRKVVRGKVETVVLAEDVYKESAEFIAPSQYRIRGVVDINGDGKMEVLMYGRYYEGHWTSVFQINGTQFKEVLSCGCGV